MTCQFVLLHSVLALFPMPTSVHRQNLQRHNSTPQSFHMVDVVYRSDQDFHGRLFDVQLFHMPVPSLLTEEEPQHLVARCEDQTSLCSMWRATYNKNDGTSPFENG